MKKIILSLLFLPLFSFAEVKEVKIPVHIHNSYFACSYLEAQTSRYLKDFGAKDIRVSCSGGLPYDQFARITASFDAPSIDDENTEWKILKYRSRRDDNCKLNTILFNTLAKSFEVTKIEEKSTCFNGDGRFQFEIVVLGYK